MMKHLPSPILILVLISCLFGVGTVHAQIQVSSIPDLQEAINNAQLGDQIILSNGSYATSSPITVGVAGTATQPILICAETIGGATISGGGTFVFNSPAAYVIVEGFFFSRPGTAVLRPGTHHIRLTRNVFDAGRGRVLDINTSDDNEIDHNSFQNKNTTGQYIRLTNQGGTCGGRNALRNWIHHNHFRDFEYCQGCNNRDVIEAGGDSTQPSYTLGEFNLFERTDGENEIISNKSWNNTWRFNTFRDSIGELTLRDGNQCTVQGNFFINTHGIRIFGDDHQIFNNYLERCNPAIVIGSGNSPDHICGAPFGGFDRPDRVQITFNTLVNNVRNVAPQGGRPLGATDLVFANNIIQGGGTAVTGGAPLTNPTWAGNILWTITSAGIVPASGYTRVDPQLEPDDDGIFHIGSTSPAIDASVGSFPYVIDDMDGQPRDSEKNGRPPDVGADEFSKAPVTRWPLTLSDVGPYAYE